jgi:probable rRNA maturation factor
MKFTIEIAQDNSDWNLYSEIKPTLFKQILSKIIKNYENFSKIKNIELSILLTNDNRMQQLNQEFRNKNSATNVLSFPDVDINFRRILEFEPNLDYMYLGDIAFSFETIFKEAKEKKLIFLDHFKHLLLHSILHLIGYDHNNDEETEIMQNIEINILQQLSIKSPYL